MARPKKLERNVVDTWLAEHPDWAREEEAGKNEALVRSFRFPDFAGALAFVVQLGMAAEKSDHHPDVLLQWGRARVLWTTHDAGGITELDLELAAKSDALAGAPGRGGAASS
jgi:4a-hydroxytetrahydrobiopterin dehydratase